MIVLLKKGLCMYQGKYVKRITVAEMAPHVHTFLPKENKADKISKWLIAWIESSLNSGKVSEGDLLPAKSDLAFHIGVSLGTMQNVFRIVEDCGYIISKQKIGSYVKNPKDVNTFDKLTSKREVACELIKRFLLENNFKVGDKLPAIRKMSDKIGVPATTIRIAINTLITAKILEEKSTKFYIKSLYFDIKCGESRTLVDKVAEAINSYIKQYLSSGDKLPSAMCLADMFNVSIKTVHDAVNILSAAGVVTTRRGGYGTTVGQINESELMYCYEQVQEKIKKYIAENCTENDRLPTIKNFAEVFNVSAKTIKKALDNLAYEGYITFVQGRYGGTYVTAIPPLSEAGYAWLALSPEFETKD